MHIFKLGNATTSMYDYRCIPLSSHQDSDTKVKHNDKNSTELDDRAYTIPKSSPIIMKAQHIPMRLSNLILLEREDERSAGSNLPRLAAH